MFKGELGHLKQPLAEHQETLNDYEIELAEATRELEEAKDRVKQFKNED